MNDPKTMPSLESPVAPELPTRLLRSPYFILRTPIGGYYLDPAFNANLVKSPVNSLSLFLADAQRVPAAGSELGEVKYLSRENLRPLRFIHEGALREFAEAASDFCKGGLNADQTSLRQGFRLPDPDKEPDAYWVCGDRFAPRLLILWGCEKAQGSSLPLVGDGRNVVKELRAKAMSWTRLFREGVELSRLQDPLAPYIAFPVLSPEGKLTHVDRLVNGQYVREPVQSGGGGSWKVRPLKRLPAGAIQQFKDTARDFYQKAHGTGCACPSCAPEGAPKPSSGKAAPPVLTYEQEVRRGFRLPDPDLRPDAYFVAGRAMSKQLLILCPNPWIKDAEEIAQMEKDLKWAEDKARTPEDKEQARQLRAQYEEDLAAHNLYKPYFYEEQECLPLIADKVLGLPVPAAKSPGDSGLLPVPSAMRPKPEGKPTEQTVAAKLKSTNVAVLATVWAGILLLLIAAIGAYFYFKPAKAPQLAVISAAMSNDPLLDPGNNRNVIEVVFNNALEKNSDAGTNDAAGPFGLYKLHFNGDELKLRPPQLNPASNKVLTLTIDVPGVTLSEDGKYTLFLEKARDVWKHVLPLTNIQVTVVDKRPPAFLREETADVGDLQDSILIAFDEPLDKPSAETPGNYSVAGPIGWQSAIKSAQLQKDLKTVLLTADKPFESDADYQLTLSANITDASHARNHLRPSPLTTNFTYGIPPLRLRTITADSQTSIRLVFNRPVDLNSAKSNGVLKFQGAALKSGLVEALDKTLTVYLTNSYMTNGSNTLIITSLKDTIGKAGGVLSTNVAFSYTGSIDRTPPVILPDGIVFAGSNRLHLAFSKDLREDTATMQSHYEISVFNGSAWLPIETHFQAELLAGTNRVVALNSTGSLLAGGRLRLHYFGVEDLTGNSTNDTREISTIFYGITCLKGPQFTNPERTEVRFVLSPSIDAIHCKNPDNFSLQDASGKPISTVEILKVTFNPGDNITEVKLYLSKGLAQNKFVVRCSKMRVEGQVLEQEVLAPAPEP